MDPSDISMDLDKIDPTALGTAARYAISSLGFARRDKTLGLEIYRRLKMSEHRRLEKEASSEKKKPSEMMLDIYRTNKARLANELGKDIKDQATHDSIAAYEHILHHMRACYDFPEV